MSAGAAPRPRRAGRRGGRDGLRAGDRRRDADPRAGQAPEHASGNGNGQRSDAAPRASDDARGPTCASSTRSPGARAELPGVRAAGFIQMLPLQNWGWTANSSDFVVRGRPPITPIFPIQLRYVTPGYFEALGIPIVKGRGFTDRDEQGATPVILVNETLARRFFGDDDPTGQVTTRGSDRRRRARRPPGAPRSSVSARDLLPGRAELVSAVGSRHDAGGRGARTARSADRAGSGDRPRGEPRPGDLQCQDDGARGGRLAVGFHAVPVADRRLRGAGARARADRHLRRHRLSGVGAHQGVRHPRRRSGPAPAASRASCSAAEWRSPESVWRSASRRRCWPRRSSTACRSAVRPPGVATVAPVAAFIALVAIAACLVPALRAARVSPMVALRDE